MDEEAKRYYRERVARRVRAGLCAKCGSKRNRHRSKSRCTECLDRGKLKAAARKAEQLCVQCQRPKTNGKTLCDDCNEKVRLSRERLRNERHLEGLCTVCGKPKINPLLKSCGKCRAKARAWTAQRAAGSST